MAIPPIAPSPVRALRSRIMGNTRLAILLVLLVFLAMCLVFELLTRDAMGNLSFLNAKSGSNGSLGTKKTIVDLSPWQTAQALAALAVTAEETEYAHDAERLADHEVDQAFATALRQATIQAEHRTLTGEALALSQRIAQRQQLVAQDQAQVHQLTGGYPH